MEEKEFEWVSVSEVAEREGVTAQTIYLRVRCGLYETMKFKRGKMNGILIKVPKQQNNYGIKNSAILSYTPESKSQES